MSDVRDGSVPTWDGAARGWRRYAREVAWYVQSTPAKKSGHCASRLMGRLTGPARLLAMSWQQAAFDAEDGTVKLLRRLASSPLVRRSLPNAAAICQQYFSFRRSAHESIGNFLVRETLVHEEFVEALIRLHEEKLGISQADRDFGLPPIEESWSDYEWGDQAWEDGSWWYYEDELNSEADGAGASPEPDSPEEPRSGEGEAAADHPGADPAERVRATTGSSPSHREEVQSPTSRPRRREAPSVAADGPAKAIDELTIADSFIMGVLRGWRLLQAAGLTPEEKRDILSTSRNSLDYEVIAQALQGLWDEQLLGNRHGGPGGRDYQCHANYHEEMDTYYSEEPNDWYPEETGWWDHQGYAAEWDDEPWWTTPYDDAFPTTMEEPNEIDDEKVKEAQQAERVAEQLAMEARRTWSEAQKATQALKRDRGFGAISSNSGGGRCFNCGGPHFARDCPKGKGKSKGKKGFNGHYLDDMDGYFIGKGKGKGKSKGKYGQWLEGQASWMKGKNKGKEPSRTVNAYSSDLFLAGLEVAPTMDLSSMSASRADPQMGMLDSGATASAAPEAVVKGLVEAVLSRDRGARIDLEQYSRPYFRFGNGKWGRALGRTTITSNVSGHQRQFSLYTLPNPTEYYASHFDKSSLVPVLVGMDFLGPEGMGMAIDFSTGLALNSKEQHPEVYRLRTNVKGHYVLDIVEFLTQGKVNLEGPDYCVCISDHNLCVLNSLMLQPRLLKCVIKNSTKPKAKAAPLDPARRVTMDVRDPRAQESQWPCYQQHTASRVQANAHGAWVHCAVCLEYVPRKGSPASTTKTENPAMVKRMLEQLQGIMGMVKPTQAICLAMQKKIDAEEQLNHMVTEQMANPQAPKTTKAGENMDLPTAYARLHLEGQDGLWEISGSPHNWLSEAAQRHQLRPRSINLSTGYDLYKESTWKHLRELQRLHHPRRLWFSLPFSKWCPWNEMNYNTPEQREQLKTYRRREQRMLWNANQFIKDAMNYDPDVQVYWEWPHMCRGWSQQALGDLGGYFQEKGVPWQSCRVDGCCYGLLNEDGTAFVQKPWQIRTTDENFHRRFRAKLCAGNHRHCTKEGHDRGHQAYYPWKMVQAIARHWHDQVVPQRHLHLLALRQDLPGLVDAGDDGEPTMEEVEVLDSNGDSLNFSDVNDVMLNEAGRITLETMAREARLRQVFTFQNLQMILNEFFSVAAPSANDNQRWRQAPSFNVALGAYSHGAFGGICKYTNKHLELVCYINAFIRHHQPLHQWSSLMVSKNSRTLPHRDHHNLDGSWNMLIGVGDYRGGGLWVGDESPDGGIARRVRLPSGKYQPGHVRDTREKFVYFRPQIEHAPERWTGTRITISAYTTRMLPHLSSQDQQALKDFGFCFEKTLQSFTTTTSSPDEAQATATTTEPTSETDLPDGVSQKEMEAWKAKVAKFHKAAGHPTNRNLAKIIGDAGHPQWKIDVASHHECPACQALRPGGPSTGQVPPASTHASFRAWECVGVDTGEWIPPGKKKKVKFILFMDMATRLRVVQPLFISDFLETKMESGDDFIRVFSERWLGSYPKPKVVVMDSAKSFSSTKVSEFLADIGVQSHLVAEKEPWANGMVEACVQDVKHVASAIHLEAQDVNLDVILHLAASSLNSTEYVAGYSSHQWAFGAAYVPTDEDVRTYHLVEPKVDYMRLVTARQKAEEIAIATRAQRALSKLANTTVRQPLREFSPMDLVKVWRRVWPREQHTGPRGGFKKSGKPHWIGPGRVIFSEVLPHQSEGDHRRHIVWVLIGRQLLRCSVHSVRPVNEVERFQYETTTTEDATTWRSLADLLPRREYEDMVDQEPNDEELELPQLPAQPDPSTMVAPPRRLRTKTSNVRFEPYGAPIPGSDEEPLQEPQADSDVNDYQIPATSSTTTVPQESESQVRPPDAKRPKTHEVNWVQEMEAQAMQEENEFDVFQAMEETNEFLRIEFDVEAPASNRQRKLLDRNPTAYMVKKMRDSEVKLSRLQPHEEKLFTRAKAKEVDSFIRNEAVRKCLDDKKIAEAYESGRIVKARWVLTWKPIPPEDREEALRDAQTNAETLHDKRGLRKAKARIVLLGFQHPNLLDPSFKTSSPVQSTLGRNLLYLMSVTHQWELEGLDLATAFLQTMPTEADSELFTTGVEELREALGVDEEGIMKILRNIYGSTTAPRGLWLSLHRKLTELGGIAVLGERCLWIWLSKHEMDRGRPRVIGAMGGHVDDFHRLGDKQSDEWLAVREQVDKAYKWGTAKTGRYRHAGTDITTTKDERGLLQITVDQSYYIDGIQDLEIDADRLQQEGPLLPREIGACRTALGALQWIAVQSQPQLCSRCNLLLTEVVSSGTLQSAREIQAMISEIRRESYKLEFFKLDGVKHWSDLVFISMGDQAHNNRGKGDSTGGLLTLVAGPESIDGQVCPMMLLAWRTWKLRRKALGSNDAEVQSVYEAEDQNFRVRLLWTEMHGAREPRQLREDLVQASEKQCLQVKGILCTDSRGGYDALEKNESPLLGLSNMRAALQAFSLRDNLARVACELRWLASDYNLSDSMTKKKLESRLGLLKFLQTKHWAIKYDPSFSSAKRSKQQGHTALRHVDRHLRSRTGHC
ncbi:GIP [Symbiodinium sp. CCMP2456]|nr:GIP [Symbiodinium sp. CCMP2456]